MTLAWSLIRRMIDLSTMRNRMDDRLRLNGTFRSVMEWSRCKFLSSWNGVSILALFHKEVPNGLISDASGRWEFGAFHEHDWFQLQWNSTSEPWHKTIKELIPRVIAASIWGHRWAGKTIRALCDNMVVLHIINRLQSRDPGVPKIILAHGLYSCSTIRQYIGVGEFTRYVVKPSEFQGKPRSVEY